MRLGNKDIDSSTYCKIGIFEDYENGRLIYWKVKRLWNWEFGIVRHLRGNWPLGHLQIRRLGTGILGA